MSQATDLQAKKQPFIISYQSLKLMVHPMCTFWLPDEQILVPVHAVCICFFSIISIPLKALYKEGHVDKLLGAPYWLPMHLVCAQYIKP